MEQDSGWVELQRGEPPEVLGRARAVVTFAPLPPGGASTAQRGQLVSVRAPWEGRLESVHLAEGVAGVEPGPHYIKYELSGERLYVSIDEWHALEDQTGFAVIHSLDNTVPSAILELGGE